MARAIPARTSRKDTGLDFRQPVMVLNALFMAASTFLTCGLQRHGGAQYSDVEETRAYVEICSVHGRMRSWQMLESPV